MRFISVAAGFRSRFSGAPHSIIAATGSGPVRRSPMPGLIPGTMRNGMPAACSAVDPFEEPVDRDDDECDGDDC